MNPKKMSVLIMALLFATLVISLAPAFAQVDTAWVRRYDATGYSDVARAIAVDDSGNVYVTGTANDDYVTIKYDSDGDTA